MKKLTVTGKTDGFGAQYKEFIFGIAYCNYMNYEYIHTPIKISGGNHLVNNNDKNFDSKMKEIIGNLNDFIGIPYE